MTVPVEARRLEGYDPAVYVLLLDGDILTWFRHDDGWRVLPDGPRTTVDREWLLAGPDVTAFEDEYGLDRAGLAALLDAARASAVVTAAADRRVGPTDVYRRCSDGEPGHPLALCVVVVRCGNYSAFNGYRFTPSDYSCVVCTACGTPWRTAARYVGGLPDGDWDGVRR